MTIAVTTDHQFFGEPGGHFLDDLAIGKAAIHAEMCELARQFCFDHSTKIVDAILARFEVTRRPIKEHT